MRKSSLHLLGFVADSDGSLVGALDLQLATSVSTGGFRGDREKECITKERVGCTSSEGVLLLGKSSSVSLLLGSTTLLSDNVPGVVVSSIPDNLDFIDTASSTSEIGDGRLNNTTSARNAEVTRSSGAGDSISVSKKSFNLELVKSINIVKLE